MRKYKVKNTEHVVYDDVSEVPKELKLLEDWRDGEIGDWVIADDNSVLQILRVGYMAKPSVKDKAIKYVGTCTGTFVARMSDKMDTDRRTDIYSFSGMQHKQRVNDREDPSSGERVFAQFIAAGMDRTDAYMRAFKTENPDYATYKAAILVKQERIKTEVRKELKPVLQKLGINEEFVLEGIRQIAEGSKKDADRLKALFELSDVLEIKEKKKEYEMKLLNKT